MNGGLRGSLFISGSQCLPIQFPICWFPLCQIQCTKARHCQEKTVTLGGKYHFIITSIVKQMKLWVSTLENILKLDYVKPFSYIAWSRGSLRLWDFFWLRFFKLPEKLQICFLNKWQEDKMFHFLLSIFFSAEVTNPSLWVTSSISDPEPFAQGFLARQFRTTCSKPEIITEGKLNNANSESRWRRHSHLSLWLSFCCIPQDWSIQRRKQLWRKQWAASQTSSPRRRHWMVLRRYRPEG